MPAKREYEKFLSAFDAFSEMRRSEDISPENSFQIEMRNTIRSQVAILIEAFLYGELDNMKSQMVLTLSELPPLLAQEVYESQSAEEGSTMELDFIARVIKDFFPALRRLLRYMKLSDDECIILPRELIPLRKRDAIEKIRAEIVRDHAIAILLLRVNDRSPKYIN